MTRVFKNHMAWWFSELCESLSKGVWNDRGLIGKSIGRLQQNDRIHRYRENHREKNTGKPAGKMVISAKCRFLLGIEWKSSVAQNTLWVRLGVKVAIIHLEWVGEAEKSDETSGRLKTQAGSRRSWDILRYSWEMNEICNQQCVIHLTRKTLNICVCRVAWTKSRLGWIKPSLLV